MPKSTKRMSVLAALAWILFALPTCSMSRVGVLVNPPDLATAPDCFWEQYAALASGDPGPYPCVEIFIGDALQKDCETDDMFNRKTSQVRKCANYSGPDE